MPRVEPTGFVENEGGKRGTGWRKRQRELEKTKVEGGFLPEWKVTSLGWGQRQEENESMRHRERQRQRDGERLRLGLLGAQAKRTQPHDSCLNKTLHPPKAVAVSYVQANIGPEIIVQNNSQLPSVTTESS